MRSLLGISATLMLMMAAGDALAADGGQWKSSGKMRVRNESMENGLISGYNGTRTLMGFRWDLMFQPDDKTTVFFQPNFAKTFGLSDGTSGTTPPIDEAASDTFFTAHQAYFAHKITDSLTFTAGRQELSYGDQLVIGPVGWSFVGRSFDLIKGRFTMDQLWVDLFVSKTTETDYAVAPTGATGPVGGADTDFYGLYLNYSGIPMIKNLDVYYLTKNNPTMSASNITTTNVSAVGFRAATDFSGIDVRAEYTTQSGKRDDNFLTAAYLVDNPDGTITGASQYDLEIGYTLDMEVKPRFSVEVFNAGKNYDQFYPTAHKWLGHADLFGRRNISGFVGHVSVPWQDFTFKLDYHMFSRVDKDYTPYKLNGTSGWGTASVTENLAVGSEADLQIGYKFSSAMNWNLGYASFTPGDYMKAQGTAPHFSKAVNLMYLEMTATF